MHLIGTGCDNEILWPYENALIRMKVPFGVAEPVAIDAPRSDMFLRRFRMQAVVGLSGELVDALLALGRDLKALLGAFDVGRVAGCGCRSCARTASCRGRWCRSARCSHSSRRARDGARYDESEWLIEEDGGRVAADERRAARVPVRAAAHRRRGPRRGTRDGRRTERVVFLTDRT